MISINLFEVLCEYVVSQAPGAMLDYVTVQQATGVDMTARSGGRNLLFRAVRRVWGTCKVIRNAGVRLPSAKNAAEFSEDGVIAVLKKTDREAKRSRKLVQRFGAEMSDDDKKRVIAHGSAFGAIALASRVALAAPKIEQRKEPPKPRLPG